jgi:hypothetical protein
MRVFFFHALLRVHSNDSHAPENVSVRLLSETQHLKERKRALREADRKLVRFVAFFAFVEVAVVFGEFFFIERDGGLQLLDSRRQFFVRDDAAFAQPLADDPKEIIGEVVEHLHIGRGSGFECD